MVPKSLTVPERETETPNVAPTRRSSTAVFRGGVPDTPADVSTSAGDTKPHKRNRVLALKVEIDWQSESSKQLFRRLRDLGWQAARYRNGFVRRLWAESQGFRVEDQADKHGITKQGRREEKGELSGAAYSAAEREVAAAWGRDAAKVLAGQPLPEWSPGSALSVRGHKRKNESGIRLEMEGGKYVAYLQAQATKKGEVGSGWLRLPIAPRTTTDEYQGPILQRMVLWETPIAKAAVRMSSRDVTLLLAYALEYDLPQMGQRVATLGPIGRDGRLHLRTETQTKDYTSKLANITERKDKWDLIRRRALKQIGWRKGQARIKREQLARLSWDDWLKSYLHEWSRQMVEWVATQGVGAIRVVGLQTGDWPAYRFIELIRYKAEDLGITVEEGSDVKVASAERAAKSEINKMKKRTTRRRAAVRELQHQLGG